MNSVYYIFLVVVIISFITGLIITFIDNARGEPIENEEKPRLKKASKASKKKIGAYAISKETKTASIPIIDAQDDLRNTVPYIPCEEISTVNMNTDSFAEPIILQTEDVNPADIYSYLHNDISDNHKIQIENTQKISDKEGTEYFSVPVLVPLPMDDDSL